MQTRTRQHGTKEFFPKTAEERLSAFRTIVEEKQFAKIDDEMIDLFSASFVMEVYNKLSEANKEKVMQKIMIKPAAEVAMFCFNLVNNAR